MKRTNTNEYKALIEAHILESITSEDVDIVTPKDKINYFFAEFDRVANHNFNLRRFPNTQERLADFLSGIPFSFEWTSDGIIKLCEKMHECKLTDKQAQICVEGYFMHISQHLLRIKAKQSKDKHSDKGETKKRIALKKKIKAQQSKEFELLKKKLFGTDKFKVFTKKEENSKDFKRYDELMKIKLIKNYILNNPLKS